MPHVALRPASPGDHDLLVSVYASTRAAELALLSWSDADKDAFVRAQFAAQDRHYRAYENARFDVVEVDGRPAGRLLVARWPRELRIMDIALLESARGRGVGTRLIGDLLAEAAESGRFVSIHVEADNPAKRLYERLGFAVAAVLDGGVYERWEARPTGAAGTRPAAR